VLRGILDHGPVARSNLARLTGMSPASMSGVTRGLVELGLIREVPEAAGPPGFGRPHVPLDLAESQVVAFAVHFAVPHATVAAVDLRGRVLSSRLLPYRDPTPAKAVDGVVEQLRVLAESYADRRVLGVGVATGGWVDAEAGVVVDHGLLRWRDVPLREMFARAIGLPTYVENHGRALLAAEQLFGKHAQRARESSLHLFIGNVVDAAFAIRGRTHQGRRSASGNLVHLPVDADPAISDSCPCGRLGCFQAAVSERILIRRAAELGVQARYVTELSDRARAGDDRIADLFVDRARSLGHAIAYLVDLFNPEVLAVTEAGFMWVPRAREALLAEVAARSETVDDPATVIVPSSFEGSLAVAGAASLLDKVFASPLGFGPVLSSAS